MQPASGESPAFNVDHKKVIASNEVMDFSRPMPKSIVIIGLEYTVAVENGLTLEQVFNSMHPHPTLTEMILETCKRAVGLSFDK